ncbi:Crp/Fnr family transcriptional regulator [Dyadobacter psychrophilus]|uniref:cAMP-binding domain of CRP or a regulatory subunit of cAMP-dependent protein kinases n=1 Tax=Dyadobacter psychrophilus TaxID=651661 RepID=A0A1T5B7I7_9BACT|nr:Crp/Fnr family transcriptional regulator [Dyadobacter psychrophilus]SKB42930.1 cAMP-binding domain of CRP or a regulatory subunit of cAMP-dependent protein kinases [Dyadobacter psychrophilus]
MIETDLLLIYGAVYKKVYEDEVIFREGENCLFYHQLVEGKVGWSNFNEDGSEILQGVVWPAECFGELPLFDQQPYACTATALTECLIIRLALPDFNRLLSEHSEVRQTLNRLFAQKLRFKLFLAHQLACHSPERIVDEVFKYLHLHTNNVCGECNKLMLTRQQVANLTGMRVETIIRATKILENKGKLKIVRGKIFLPARIETETIHGHSYSSL